MLVELEKIKKYAVSVNKLTKRFEIAGKMIYNKIRLTRDNPQSK